MNAKSIDVQITKGSQSCHYLEYLEGTRGKRIKISIRTDPHDGQGHATSHVWDGDQWQECYRILNADMATNKDLAYKGAGRLVGTAPPTIEFKHDRERLIELTHAIIK